MINVIYLHLKAKHNKIVQDLSKTHTQHVNDQLTHQRVYFSSDFKLLVLLILSAP